MIPQFDFSKSVVSAANPDLLPYGALRSVRNCLIDNDQTLLAMPWYLTRCKSAALTNGFGNTRYIRRSDVPVWHWDGAATTMHNPRTNWRLTSMESVITAYMYNDARDMIEQAVTNVRTFDGGAYTLTGHGISNFTLYRKPLETAPVEYIAVHGSNAGAGGAPNAFMIVELRYVSAVAAPTSATIHSVAAANFPIRTGQGYVSGAKFPKVIGIYKDRMFAVASHNDLMCDVLMWSDAGNFATISGNGATAAAGTGGWGDTSSGFNQTMDNPLPGGENLTGFVFAGALWIPNTRGIARVVGNDPGTMQVDAFEVGNGCVAEGSVQVYKNAMIFLSSEGFMIMGPEGEGQLISEAIRDETMAMIASMRLRGGYGAFDQNGGSSYIVDNKYCYLWPNDGDLWCFDLKHGRWTMHDARAAFASTYASEAMPRPFLLGGSRGKMPTIQYIRDKATTKLLHTKRIEPIEIGSNSASIGYKSEFDDFTNDVVWRAPWRVELAPMGGEDRTPKRPESLLLDVELNWINDQRSDNQSNFSVEIVNASNQTIARGVVSPNATAVTLASTPNNNYASRRLRGTIPIPQAAPYSSLMRVKIFKSGPDMNRATMYAQNGPADYLRVIAAKWIFAGETDAITDDEQAQFVFTSQAVTDNATYIERYSTIGVDTGGAATKQGLLVAQPWVQKNPGVSVWQQAVANVTPYVNPSTVNTPCGSFLSAPILNDYHIWEIEYTVIDDPAPAGNAWFIGLSLVNEGEDLDVSSSLVPVCAPEAPLTVFIQPAAVAPSSRPRMYARWYTGGVSPWTAAFSDRYIEMPATVAWFYGRTHRFRVTRVPKTGQFWIDHSIVSSNTSTDGTFATTRTPANRIEANFYTRAAQAPLNPYVTGRSDNVAANHVRWSGIDVYPLNVRVG